MTTSSGEPPLVVTLERVLELHADAVLHKGGSPGVLNHHLLESAIGGALTSALYRAPLEAPDDADPVHVAAYLLIRLARNHAFNDGNKRVAWLAMEDQLRLTALTVDATTDEAERLVYDIIARTLDDDQVIRWIFQRLVSAPHSPPDK